MMKKKSITTLSMDEVMRAEDLTRSDAAEGRALGGDFWKEAKIVHPDGPKRQLTVRLDADMVDWFREQGRGYQTRMNSVLRSYYEACKKQAHKL